jgi:hypothetical protein
MTHVFAALAIEATGGFVVAGTVTAWMRARLHRRSAAAAEA